MENIHDKVQYLILKHGGIVKIKTLVAKSKSGE